MLGYHGSHPGLVEALHYGQTHELRMNCIPSPRLLVLCAACLGACGAPASESGPDTSRYGLAYLVTPAPVEQSVAVQLTLSQGDKLLREMRFDADPGRCRPSVIVQRNSGTYSLLDDAIVIDCSISSMRASSCVSITTIGDLERSISSRSCF